VILLDSARYNMHGQGCKVSCTWRFEMFVVTLSPSRRPGFKSGSGHVRFLVDSGAGTRFLPVLRFPLPLIPPDGGTR
jgi:hypothetical protein